MKQILSISALISLLALSSFTQTVLSARKDLIMSQTPIVTGVVFTAINNSISNLSSQVTAISNELDNMPSLIQSSTNTHNIDMYAHPVPSWSMRKLAYGAVSHGQMANYLAYETNSVVTYDNPDDTWPITFSATNFIVVTGFAHIVPIQDMLTYLEIPENINGLPVLAIGPNFAYDNWPEVVTLSAPSVEHIAPAAFHGCSDLVSAYLPNVRRIDYEAFYGCTRLQSIQLPSVLHVLDSAFLGCSSATEINCPKAIYFETRAFNGANSVTNMFIPSLVTPSDDLCFDVESGTPAQTSCKIKLGNNVFQGYPRFDDDISIIYFPKGAWADKSPPQYPNMFSEYTPNPYESTHLGIAGVQNQLNSNSVLITASFTTISTKLNTNGNGSALTNIPTTAIVSLPGVISNVETLVIWTNPPTAGTYALASELNTKPSFSQMTNAIFYNPVITYTPSVTSTVTVIPSVNIYRVVSTSAVTTVVFDKSAISATSNNIATWETRIDFQYTNAPLTLVLSGVTLASPVDITCFGEYRFAMEYDGVTVRAHQTFPSICISHAISVGTSINSAQPAMGMGGVTIIPANSTATNIVRCSGVIDADKPVFVDLIVVNPVYMSTNDISVYCGKYHKTAYTTISSIQSAISFVGPKSFIVDGVSAGDNRIKRIRFVVPSITLLDNRADLWVMAHFSNTAEAYAAVLREVIVRPANELEIRAYALGWRPFN